MIGVVWVLGCVVLKPEWESASLLPRIPAQGRPALRRLLESHPGSVSSQDDSEEDEEGFAAFVQEGWETEGGRGPARSGPRHRRSSGREDELARSSGDGEGDGQSLEAFIQEDRETQWEGSRARYDEEAEPERSAAWGQHHRHAAQEDEDEADRAEPEQGAALGQRHSVAEEEEDTNRVGSGQEEDDIDRPGGEDDTDRPGRGPARVSLQSQYQGEDDTDSDDIPLDEELGRDPTGTGARGEADAGGEWWAQGDEGLGGTGGDAARAIAAVREQMELGSGTVQPAAARAKGAVPAGGGAAPGVAALPVVSATQARPEAGQRKAAAQAAAHSRPETGEHVAEAQRVASSIGSPNAASLAALAAAASGEGAVKNGTGPIESLGEAELQHRLGMGERLMVRGVSQEQVGLAEALTKYVNRDREALQALMDKASDAHELVLTAMQGAQDVQEELGSGQTDTSRQVTAGMREVQNQLVLEEKQVEAGLQAFVDRKQKRLEALWAELRQTHDLVSQSNQEPQQAQKPAEPQESTAAAVASNVNGVGKFIVNFKEIVIFCIIAVVITGLMGSRAIRERCLFAISNGETHSVMISRADCYNWLTGNVCLVRCLAFLARMWCFESCCGCCTKYEFLYWLCKPPIGVKTVRFSIQRLLFENDALAREKEVFYEIRCGSNMDFRTRCHALSRGKFKDVVTAARNDPFQTGQAKKPEAGTGHDEEVRVFSTCARFSETFQVDVSEGDEVEVIVYEQDILLDDQVARFHIAAGRLLDAVVDGQVQVTHFSGSRGAFGAVEWVAKEGSKAVTEEEDASLTMAAPRRSLV